MIDRFTILNAFHGKSRSLTFIISKLGQKCDLYNEKCIVNVIFFLLGKWQCGNQCGNHTVIELKC